MSKRKLFFFNCFLRASITLIILVSYSAPRLRAQQRGSGVPADIILHHGKVLTVDKEFSIAEAVAITGQKIDAVGRNEEVLKLAGDKTLLVDLQGKTVIPGLIDTHRHNDRQAEEAYGGVFLDGRFDVANSMKLQRFPIDWRGVSSKGDVLNQIKSWMERVQFKPGQWIYFVNVVNLIGGASPEQAKIMYEDLNRWTLDTVTPNNPVILSMGIPENNGLLVNSKAVEILWAKWGSFIQRAGHYWVDAKGRPDGHLESPATRLAQNFMYTRSAESLAPAYKNQLDELAAMGITTTASNMPQDAVSAYQLLESKGEMTVRLAYGKAQPFGNVTDLKKDMPALRPLVGSGSPMVWVNSITVGSMDGAGSRSCTGAKRVNPFNIIDTWWPSGQCYMDIEYRGAKGKGAPVEEDYYKDWIYISAANGVRFGNTHVAGDKSVAVLLNIVADIQKQYGHSATAGWSFDHCTYVNPADFARAARLGIMFSCASKYISNTASTASKAFGESVANTFITPVKSMLDAGIHVVFESDQDTYVWLDMQRFLTRKDSMGKVWGPQEKVDRATLLKMATIWAADYVLRKDKLGSIEPGKLADLVVLDRDYLAIPEDQVSKIQPQITIVGGKIVFVHQQFADQNNFHPSGALVSTFEDIWKKRTYSGPAILTSGAG